MENKEFYRQTVKLGNSSGVLLPKSLLGADVKITIINQPLNVKKDLINILENWLEYITGIYLIKAEKRKVEALAVSANLKKHIDADNYHIDIVPLELLKKSVRTSPLTRDKIAAAKTIINKHLLFEIRKEFSIRPLTRA